MNKRFHFQFICFISHPQFDNNNKTNNQCHNSILTIKLILKDRNNEVHYRIRQNLFKYSKIKIYKSKVKISKSKVKISKSKFINTFIFKSTVKMFSESNDFNNYPQNKSSFIINNFYQQRKQSIINKRPKFISEFQNKPNQYFMKNTNQQYLKNENEQSFKDKNEYFMAKTNQEQFEKLKQNNFRKKHLSQKFKQINKEQSLIPTRNSLTSTQNSIISTRNSTICTGKGSIQNDMKIQQTINKYIKHNKNIKNNGQIRGDKQKSIQQSRIPLSNILQKYQNQVRMLISKQSSHKQQFKYQGQYIDIKDQQDIEIQNGQNCQSQQNYITKDTLNIQQKSQDIDCHQYLKQQLKIMRQQVQSYKAFSKIQQNKIKQLQKQNSYQQKFIESVKKMKQRIQDENSKNNSKQSVQQNKQFAQSKWIQKQISLKQLWRWIKTLPKPKQPPQQLNNTMII